MEGDSSPRLPTPVPAGPSHSSGRRLVTGRGRGRGRVGWDRQGVKGAHVPRGSQPAAVAGYQACPPGVTTRMCVPGIRAMFPCRGFSTTTLIRSRAQVQSLSEARFSMEWWEGWQQTQENFSQAGEQQGDTVKCRGHRVRE